MEESVFIGKIRGLIGTFYFQNWVFSREEIHLSKHINLFMQLLNTFT